MVYRNKGERRADSTVVAAVHPRSQSVVAACTRSWVSAWVAVTVAVRRRCVSMVFDGSFAAWSVVADVQWRAA
jgi:hypothetical protein